MFIYMFIYIYIYNTHIKTPFSPVRQDKVMLFRAVMCGFMALWAVWKSAFPEDERFLCATVVLNYCFFFFVRLRNSEKDQLGAALLEQADGGEVYRGDLVCWLRLG